MALNENSEKNGFRLLDQFFFFQRFTHIQNFIRVHNYFILQHFPTTNTSCNSTIIINLPNYDLEELSTINKCLIPNWVNPLLHNFN